MVWPWKAARWRGVVEDMLADGECSLNAEPREFKIWKVEIRIERRLKKYNISFTMWTMQEIAT